MIGRDPIFGIRHFTDGSCRDVYLAADERQYVLGDDEEPVYGQWLVPGPEPDSPLIVSGPPEGSVP
jgi:hypothetical protein